MAKRKLPDALRANADRLKRGESLHHKTKQSMPSNTKKPKIRTKKK